MRVFLLSAIAACSHAPTAMPPEADAPPAPVGRGVISLGGQPAFPIILSLPPSIGSQTPAGADALAEVASAGVDMFKTGPGTTFSLDQARAWTAAAAAHGVYTWVNLYELSSASPGSTAETALRDAVTALATDPGLGLWKGADEPWWGHTSADSLANAYQIVHSLDPTHSLTLIQAPRGTAADLAPYSAVTDLHGIDIYPVAYGVTNPDLHQVGMWAQTIHSVTPDQGIVMALQICFSGSDDPAGSVAYVMPTRLQERFMIYDAIINGARGLSFFGGSVPACQGASDRALGWNWTFWNDVLRDQLREIGRSSELYPALLAPGTGLGLATDDPTTQVLSRQAGNDVWVIAARRGAGTATVTIRNLPPELATADVYMEGRTIDATGGQLQDAFGQWAVHVYHFTR